MADTGLYRCIATNEAGEADKQFQLEVWGKSDTDTRRGGGGGRGVVRGGGRGRGRRRV